MSTCKLWPKSCTPQGYGKLQVNGVTLLAHRVAWEEEYGPIPKGMCVLHHCDNPPCVNTEHLFLGTYLDNNRDMWAKGRWRSGNNIKTHCPRGHEYNEANTRHYEGKRFCRVCDRERS